MKLFKRRSWTTIWTAFGVAQMRQLGRDYELDAKYVVQVKERRNGTYKIRAFASGADGNTLSTLDWEYVLKDVGDSKLKEAILKYNIT